MKRFALIDWDLVHSSPVKHTYRCRWRSWLGGTAGCPPASRSLRRHLTFEWDGKNQLSVRAGRVWPSKSRWNCDELKNIAFGLCELAPRRSSAVPTGWLWFVHLNSNTRRAGQNGVLAEFLLAHQNDAPENIRARIPPRVQELLSWLEHCTRRRIHGPILVTDDEARKRILSRIDDQ
jgi:hypothetical protein